MFIKYTVLALGAYIIGSVPFSFLVARIFRNIDLRKVGSGNPGATNVYRSCGLLLGLLAFILDALKGFVSVYVLVRLLGFPSSHFAEAQVLGFIFAIADHNWTVFLQFKGGKGIAVSAGALIAINWMIFIVLIVIWILCVSITKYVSLSSIIAALLLPVMFWAFGHDILYILFGVLMAALAVYRHKANIQRLIKGEESKINEKK